MSTPLPVSVQVFFESQHSLALTAADRDSTADEFDSELNLHWLPSNVKPPKRDQAGYAEYADILFYVGASITAVAGTFLSAFAVAAGKAAGKEAGADGYKALRSLVAKLTAKLTKKSYNLRTRVLFIFDLENEYLAVQIPVHVDLVAREVSDEELESAIDDCVSVSVADLRSNWNRIEERIERFKLGREPWGGLLQENTHVVSRREGRWVISPVERQYLTR